MWFLTSVWALLSAVTSRNMYADVRTTLPAQRRPTHFCWKETPNCFCVNTPAPLSQPGGSPAAEAPRSSEGGWHGSEEDRKSTNMTRVLWSSWHHRLVNSQESTWPYVTVRDRSATLGSYLHVRPVCHPSRQLLSCEASDLQLVGVSPARFAFGREMEEGRSRVHVELQTKEQKYNWNGGRCGYLKTACSQYHQRHQKKCAMTQTSNAQKLGKHCDSNQPKCLYPCARSLPPLIYRSGTACASTRPSKLLTIWKTSDPSSKSTDAKKTLFVKAEE